MLFSLNKKTVKTARRTKRISGRGAFLLVWLRRFGISLAVLTGIIWLGTWLWLSGSVQRAADWSVQQTLAATNEMGFSVANIMVEGRKNTDAAVLLGLINVQEGDPLFAFNPVQAKELIEQITWVGDVRIERRFPDTIYIDLQERLPLALYHDGKKVVLLDQDGEAITDHDLSRFKDLVMVSGKGAAQNAPDLINHLSAEPVLQDFVESAGRVGNRRWDLKLTNNIQVHLPEHDIGFALRRLAEAHKQDAILDKNIKGIDMRETDRMIIRTRPGAVQEYKVNYNRHGRKKTSNI